MNLDFVKNNRNVIVVSILLILFAVLASPFSITNNQSGRYLPSLLRNVYPALFENDIVVDAFDRFESVFYVGLAWLLKLLDRPLSQVESVFYGLYVFSKIALVGLIYFFARPLKHGIGFFILLGVWAVFQREASVGGSFLFEPSLTHATVAGMIEIAALGFLMREKQFWFWAILAATLFIHSLMTIHLALVFFFVLVVQERLRVSKSALAGMAIFGLSFLAYWLLMTPPAFSALESSLFIAKLSNSVHVAPQAQDALDWINMIGKVLLAILVYQRFFRGEKVYKHMASFVHIGSWLALLLGLAATISGSVRLAQLQPLRIYMWVNFFVFVLLACAIVAAVKKDRDLSVLVFAVFLLNVIGSALEVLLIWFAVFVLIAKTQQLRWPDLTFLVRAKSLRVGTAILTLFAILLLMPFMPVRFDEFREPITVLTLLICLPLFGENDRIKNWKWGLVALVLFIALVGQSKNVNDYFDSRQSESFNGISQWIAQNTPEDARFITALPQARGSLLRARVNNFRARSLRTTVSESIRGPFWVAPLLGRENDIRTEQVQLAWDGENWDLDALFSLANEYDTDYLLISGDFSPKYPALQIQGEYSVLLVP